MRHYVSIRHRDLNISAVMQYPVPSNREPISHYPIVVICHGFIGNKIGVDRLFVDAANEFVTNGFLVLRFDYGGCGESSGDYGSGGFSDLVEQTKTVLDYVSSLESVDPGRIYLLGHSLGGAVALIAASHDSRVNKLILWAPVAYPSQDIQRLLGEKAIREISTAGQTDYQSYRLTRRFINSLTIHHPLQELKGYKGDVLIVHGTSDEVIPVDYCFLYQKCFWLRDCGSCDKEVILNANHTFSSIGARREAIGKTVDWLLAIHQRNRAWSDWEI